MEDEYVDPNNRRKKTNITIVQHLQVNCFYTILDKILVEFNDRFNEVNCELLICMASLSPSKSFCAFNTSKLMKLSEFYPNDFTSLEQMTLEFQLNTYIENVRKDQRFQELNGLTDLARVMVKTDKHITFPLVYKLLKLALTLPVATASVERCFSAMKIVKTNLRNRISDHFLSNCLLGYIEKDILKTVSNESVMDRFQSMKTRRELLYKKH